LRIALETNRRCQVHRIGATLDPVSPRQGAGVAANDQIDLCPASMDIVKITEDQLINFRPADVTSEAADLSG
jgi:hypothetical protein